MVYPFTERENSRNFECNPELVFCQLSQFGIKDKSISPMGISRNAVSKENIISACAGNFI